MRNVIKLAAICSLAFGAYFLTVTENGESSEGAAQLELVATAAASSPGSVNICRCMTEPGSSAWAQANKRACDNAISNRLGVPDYTTINFNQRPALNAKYKQIEVDCGL